MSDALIAQIVDRIPSLTEAQVLALNSVDTSSLVVDLVGAIETPGIEAETEKFMAQFGDSTDPGVWAIARIAVIGILTNSDTLKRAWTDVVEPFHGETLAEVAEMEVFEVENGLVQDPLPTSLGANSVLSGDTKTYSSETVVQPSVETPVAPVEVAVESAPVVEPSVPADPAAGAI